MRTLVMTGKIGPKFDNNDITIQDTVAGVYPTLFDPAVEFRFITESAADESTARWFDNGAQSINAGRGSVAGDMPNRDKFLLLASMITASDR